MGVLIRWFLRRFEYVKFLEKTTSLSIEKWLLLEEREGLKGPRRGHQRGRYGHIN